MGSTHRMTALTALAQPSTCLRWAGGLVLAWGALLCSGCTGVDMTARIPMAEMARLSPAPEVASPQVALDSALRYVREHPGADFAVGSGDSMLPLYQDRAVIILERPPLASLRAGQTVVFMNSEGLPTAHILVRRAEAVHEQRCR